MYDCSVLKQLNKLSLVIHAGMKVMNIKEKNA